MSGMGCNCGATVAATPPTKPVTRVTSEPYGILQDGRNVTRYLLRNYQMQVGILDFGGIVNKIEAPDKKGNIDNILLGFDNLQEYNRQKLLLGAVVGRYANLIAGNRFRLDGVEYFLDVDDELGINGSNSRGFSKRLWNSHIEDDTLVLTYNSPDGEGGFPGNVNASVTYHLTADNELVINYRATTDKPTVINLTNRLFFNLKGHASGDIKDHIVRIVADYFTPLDEDLVPTGEKAPVYKNMFDMRASTLLSMNIDYRPGEHGYDINFAFAHPGWNKHMASVTHANGRTLEIYSTEPGLQFNTGYHLQGIMGKGGVVYKHYGGLLLEAQHYPNIPNDPRFPTAIVRPDVSYKQTTTYVFGDSREKTPLATTVALNTTLNKSISVIQEGGNTGRVSTGGGSWSAYTVSLIALVLLVVVLVIVGVFMIYKKRNSIREIVLRKQMSRKTKYRTKPTVAELSEYGQLDLHQDLKRVPMVQSQACVNEVPSVKNKYRTSAVAVKSDYGQLDLHQDLEHVPMIQSQACEDEEPTVETKYRTSAVAVKSEVDPLELHQDLDHVPMIQSQACEDEVPTVKTKYRTSAVAVKSEVDPLELHQDLDHVSMVQSQACEDEEPTVKTKYRTSAVAVKSEVDPLELHQDLEHAPMVQSQAYEDEEPTVKTKFGTIAVAKKSEGDTLELGQDLGHFHLVQCKACGDELAIIKTKYRTIAVTEQPEDDPQEHDQDLKYFPARESQACRDNIPPVKT